MPCLPLHSSHPAEYVTQSVTGLVISPDAVKVLNTTAHTIVFKVTDAGDPVKGAVVKVDGRHSATGPAGTASIVIPKGAKTGSFPVTASGLNYISAKGILDREGGDPGRLRPLGTDEAGLKGEDDRLDAVAEPELAEDPTDM